MAHVCADYAISMRRACPILRLNRSTQRYQSHRDPRLEPGPRIRELARNRIRFCFGRLYVLLGREGWHPGRNQAYRLYTHETQRLRSKLSRRRKIVATAVTLRTGASQFGMELVPSGRSAGQRGALPGDHDRGRVQQLRVAD